MKKIANLLAIFAYAILCTVSLPTRADDSGSMLMGYCGETPYSSFTMGRDIENIAAVQFDADFATRFAGSQVTSVRVCMGGIIGRTAGVFLTDDLPAEVPCQTNPNDRTTNDYYKQDPTQFAYHFDHEAWIDCSAGHAPEPYSWVEVPLPEKYTIQEGKPFYAGFRAFVPYGAASAVIIAVEEGGTDEHCYVYFPNSAEHWGPLMYTNMAEFGFNLLIQIRIEGENLPKNNIALAAINGDEYIQLGDTCSFECVLMNMAVNDITSFDVTYSLDGVEKASKTLNAEKGLAYHEYGGFKIEGVSFDTTGEHTLSVTVSKPNGNDDTDPSDNTLTRKLTVYDKDNAVNRRVLVENFTTAMCPNCPPAHEKIHQALEGTDAILVAHHSGFYKDLFTTSADEDYIWFYNNVNSFAPAIMFDRTVVNSFVETGYPGPVFLPRSSAELATIHRAIKNIPATVEVAIEPAYDSSTRELTVTVSGKVVSTPGGADHRIHVWLTENHLLSAMAQKGSDEGANYIHDNVMRANLTDVWGDAADLSRESYQYTFTTTISKDWKPENMEIVAFLSNFDSTDPANCKVFNANKCSLSAGTGISHPHDGTTAEKVLYFNAAGQQIKPSESAFTIVRTVQDDGAISTRKVLRVNK